MNNLKHLTTGEVALRWNISKTTVMRMIKTGELQAMEIHRRVRIALAEVERYEQSKVVKVDPTLAPRLLASGRKLKLAGKGGT